MQEFVRRFALVDGPGGVNAVGMLGVIGGCQAVSFITQSDSDLTVDTL
ncbi:MAG: hypothetical protein NTW21_17140 [Verrucomicrobia bacterium]|nr:hypothetical protein [Verrucomicrobiota bacterium]